MLPRRFALPTLAALVALVAACHPPPAARPDQPPNIILILADDLGYGDPQSYNPRSRIPTPHLDAMARQGVRFTDAHTPSAVCSPTRYGLLTGRYAWRTRLKQGVLWGYDPALIDATRLTLASMLKARGYRTAMVGKWHLGLGAADSVDYAARLRPGPLAYGFDEYFGIPASLDMDPYVYLEGEYALVPPTGAVAAGAWRRDGGKGFWRAGAAAPGFDHAEVLPRLARRAVRIIEEAAADPKPLFLYFALTAPHTPWLPTAEFVGQSQAGPYGDFVVQTDAVLGQVRGALERTGQAANTLVIFTSDNGAYWRPEDIARWGHASNAPWRGQKADAWEGGHRVPFVAYWPGRVEGGRAESEPVELTDMMATLAAVTGAALPPGAGEDSYDISAALYGASRSAPLREALVSHSARGHFAIRKGSWKLIAGLGSGGFSTRPADEKPGPGDPEGQLYDLAEDPGETRNRYAERPEKVAELKALLARYQQSGRSAR